MTVPAWRMERPECEPPPTLTMSVSPRMMHLLDGHLDHVGNDLGEARLVTLAARLRADHDLDPAVRLHLDLGALLRGADRELDVIREAEAEQLAARGVLAALREAVPIGE